MRVDVTMSFEMAYQWFWGVLLVVVGTLMVVFNKQYAERTAPLIRVRLAIADRPRLLSVLVGLALLVAGTATIVAALMHHDLSR